MKLVLIATENQDSAKSISCCLDEGYKVKQAGSLGEALRLLAKDHFDYAFVDLAFLSQGSSPDEPRHLCSALKAFRNSSHTVPLIILASPQDIRATVSAVKQGADDYLICPIEPSEVALVIENLAEQAQIESELEYLRNSFWKTDPQDLVQTRSPLMCEVYRKVESVAPTRATVLISGETGTGKSLLAKLIHTHGSRAGGPFVEVHCGAIHDNLVESELFGHEKGSFTGAERRKLGKFEIADRGTIFLDEVGTISPSAQIKLLQVLQEGAFSQVGGEATLEVDVRVIAASNEDLASKVQDRSFRSDLYYRLNVFAIELPPLRDRPEDIPHLVDFFLQRLEGLYGKGINGIDPEVKASLCEYSWPGNIRELENLLERAYILERSSKLSAASFPPDLNLAGLSSVQNQPNTALSLTEVRRLAMEQVEKSYLLQLLGEKKGRIDQSAAQAGVTPRQLHNLMAKYGLNRRDFL
ncbi:MAG: sigma-54 dependent transcriptional regulator [Desulfarculaceae bacterium]|jgi:DNA-binding NtrC family response regulator